eukprot:725527-Ditylum_brightwellii.AAC.1
MSWDGVQDWNTEDFAPAFSDNIGMVFGLDKCAVLTIRHGKSEPTDIFLEIPQLDEEQGSRYLGVYKGADFLTEHVKKATSKEYLSQVYSILICQLNADSTMTAIYSYAVPVIRYTAGIITNK